MPGPLSCLLDCRPLLLGAWSACPAVTILSDTVRSPTLSMSLVMDMLACLHDRLSLRKVHNRLWTVPAPTILVEEGRVCNHFCRGLSKLQELLLSLPRQWIGWYRTEKSARGSISYRGQGTIPTQYIGLKTHFPPTVDLHWRTNLITFVTFVAPLAAIGLVRLHWRHGECMGNISENT